MQKHQLLAAALPPEITRELEQWRESKSRIDERYHAQKVCELLSAGVRS